MNTIKPDINLRRFIAELPKFFKDKYAFVRELIQNAFRADAHKIDITYDVNKFIISDDGHGISDPQKLLTLADSGWEHQLADLQQPAGMGLYAAICTADSVSVDSKHNGGGFSISLEKSRIENLDDIPYQQCSRINNGTTVEIKGKFDLVQLEIVIGESTRFMKTGLTGKEMAIRLNGELIELLDFLLEPQSKGVSDNILLIKDVAAGKLGIYEYTPLYNQHALCSCQIISMPSAPVQYRLVVNPLGLTPRLPDRSAFVEDEKLKHFMDELYEAVRELIMGGKLKVNEDRIEILSSEEREKFAPQVKEFEIDANILNLPSDPWWGWGYDRIVPYAKEEYEFVLVDCIDSLEAAQVCAACNYLPIRIGVTGMSKCKVEELGLNKEILQKMRDFDEFDIIHEEHKKLVDHPQVKIWAGVASLKDKITNKVYDLEKGIIPLTEADARMEFLCIGEKLPDNLWSECYDICRLLISIRDDDPRETDAYDEEFSAICGNYLKYLESPEKDFRKKIGEALQESLSRAGIFCCTVEDFKITDNGNGAEVILPKGEKYILSKNGWREQK